MSATFLTKIEIDHETAYKAGLRDSYAWHQKTWQAFPGRDGEVRDFLTRLDDTDQGFRLLILSACEPVRPDWCPENSWQSKPVPEAFFQHPAYRFSLLANPTKKVRSDQAGQLLKNSRRVPLSHREDLLDWLARKAKDAGFTFDPASTRTVPRPRQSFVKKGKAGLHSVTEFIGLLHVTDHSLFQKAAIAGIGPAKAFGFGMLCLSPA
jgi:CRISPR system Cascade subunit CasE